MASKRIQVVLIRKFQFCLLIVLPSLKNEKTHKNKFTVLCKSVSFTKTIKHLLTQNLTTMGKTVKNKEKVKDW